MTYQICSNKVKNVALQIDDARRALPKADYVKKETRFKYHYVDIVGDENSVL